MKCTGANVKSLFCAVVPGPSLHWKTLAFSKCTFWLFRVRFVTDSKKDILTAASGYTWHLHVAGR